MNSGIKNKVPENGNSLYFHSSNRLSPEKAAEMLRQRGVDISMEQATQILELLRKFAHIVVSQHLESQKQNVMHKAD